MVMSLLRFIAWNALVILRVPFRLVFIVMAGFSLVMTITGIVSLPFGGLGDNPLWAQLFVVVFMAAMFAIWSWLAYFYDTLIFKLTPEDREILLSE